MLDAKQITYALRGKWYRRYGTAACPVCQSARAKGHNALTLADGKDGRLLAHCKKSACAFGDILAAAGIAPGDYAAPDPFEAAQRQAQDRAEAARRGKALPVASCASLRPSGRHYLPLASEGCTCPLIHSG